MYHVLKLLLIWAASVQDLNRVRIVRRFSGTTQVIFIRFFRV